MSVKKRGPQKRGKVTRARLLDAARALVSEREVDDFTFRDIYDKAGVQVGSAYHFFRNKEDVLAALALNVTRDYVVYLGDSLSERTAETWQDLVDLILDLASELDRSDPASFRGIPPRFGPASELRTSYFDTMGQLFFDEFDRRFVLPEIEDPVRIFSMFSEIANVFFANSFQRCGSVEPSWVAEAKWACKNYLAMYLPGRLATKSPNS